MEPDVQVAAVEPVQNVVAITGLMVIFALMARVEWDAPTVLLQETAKIVLQDIG